VALGDLERAVMEVLWQHAPGMTVREVHEALASRELAYTTVMTVLDRLAKKGLTERERDGRVWSYSAAASREALAASFMRQSFETLETTDRRAALLHFLDDADPAEIADLRAALAEVERRHAGDTPVSG
jgi:predicted transcriptional regulator